jgi:hypothetical protein
MAPLNMAGPLLKLVTEKPEVTMTRYAGIGFLMCAALLTNVNSASAQRWGRENTPRAGACFYEDINFSGRYFCTAAGADAAEVPNGVNDRISSVRIFGNAEVTVYRDPSFRGQAKVFNSDVTDLRRLGFNDRISSYHVDLSQRYDQGRNSRNDRDGWYDRSRNDRDRDDRNDNDRVGNRIPRPAATVNSRWSVGQAQEIVRRGFRSVLGRDVDPQGLRSWTEQVMANDWTQRDLENQLRNTDEYRQTQGGRRR